MYKKYQNIIYFLLAAFILFSVSSALAQDGRALHIDKSHAAEGVLQVSAGQLAGRTRLMVENLSPGMEGTSYLYEINGDGEEERFPLQMGSGLYRVTALEQSSGNRYRIIYQKELQVEIADPQAVYLQSVQAVNWEESPRAASKTEELTAGLRSDFARVRALYQYVVENIHYDNDKVSTLRPGYLPDIEETLQSGSGICYDYASLFAAMLRSAGIPTRLVKGYSGKVDGYHAWNEVYINGAWLLLDTSYDAQLKALGQGQGQGQAATMFKSDSDYHKVYQY